MFSLREVYCVKVACFSLRMEHGISTSWLSLISSLLRWYLAFRTRFHRRSNSIITVIQWMVFRESVNKWIFPFSAALQIETRKKNIVCSSCCACLSKDKLIRVNWSKASIHRIQHLEKQRQIFENDLPLQFSLCKLISESWLLRNSLNKYKLFILVWKFDLSGHE